MDSISSDSLVGPVPISKWKALVSFESSAASPICMSHAPLLARGDLGNIDYPCSSLLYPPGFRGSVLNATPGGEFWELSQSVRPSSSLRPTSTFHHVAQELREFQSLSLKRQLELTALLNCVTGQRLIIPRMRQATEARFDDVLGGHLIYEFSRAMVRVWPNSKSARVNYRRLIGESPDRALRFSAAVQLCANLVRVDLRPEEARGMIDLTLESTDGHVYSEFRLKLMKARLQRLLALVCLKLKDFGAATRAIEEAMVIARDLTAVARGGEEYGKLLAAENLRITLESMVKFAAGKHDKQSFVRYSSELLAMDGNDPYTWRTISEYAARLGAGRAARLAALGQFGLSGPGVPQAVEILTDEDLSTDVSLPALESQLLAALRATYDPRFGGAQQVEV